jgi:hypothetical protein
LGSTKTRAALSLPLFGAAIVTAAFALVMVRAIEPIQITPDTPTYASASVGMLILFIAVVCGPALLVYLLSAWAALAGSSRRWVWIVLLAASVLLAGLQFWGLAGALEEFPGALWLVAMPIASVYVAALSLFAVLPGRVMPVPSAER